MTLSIDKLIKDLKIYSPLGVDLPRDSDDNNIATLTITRWASDAAQKINERRSKSTTKETIITLVADQVDYDLPADCRLVIVIDRKHATAQSSQVLGIPTQRHSFGLGPFGLLPNGQEITPALDAINRGRLARTEDEDDFELFAGNIRFLFPIQAGEKVKVRYSAVDRDFADVGDDRFTMILDYLVLQNLDWWLAKHGVSLTSSGDSLGGADSTPVLFRRKRELEESWTAALNAIGPEAN